MALSNAQLRAIVWWGSIALHVGIACAVVSIKKAPPRKTPTAIAVRETKKKKPETKESKPEPKVETPQKAIAAAAPPKPAPKAAPPPPAAAPAAAPAPVTAAAPAAVSDFGLTLGNSGGGTIAVAAPVAAGGGPTAAPTASVAPTPKILGPKPVAGDECTEVASKPKPIQVPQPSYTEKAREAQVEGRVRVELVVDESGKVASARVIQGLGHGLDEAALAAAKSATFAAATKCGKAVSATFVIGMRFAL